MWLLTFFSYVVYGKKPEVEAPSKDAQADA